jgi:tetratricopeptide (TPR) repeat protein
MKHLLHVVLFTILFLNLQKATFAESGDRPSVYIDSLSLDSLEKEINEITDLRMRVEKYFNAYPRFSGFNKSEAIKSMKAGLRLADSISHNEGSAMLLWQIGLNYQLIGLYDSAYQYFIHSIKKAHDNNLTEIQARALHRLASLYHRTGKADSAVKNSNKHLP